MLWAGDHPEELGLRDRSGIATPSSELENIHTRPVLPSVESPTGDSAAGAGSHGAGATVSDPWQPGSVRFST